MLIAEINNLVSASDIDNMLDYISKLNDKNIYGCTV